MEVMESLLYLVLHNYTEIIWINTINIILHGKCLSERVAECNDIITKFEFKIKKH